jgi:F-type H+-transporting ATPase subunit alpha
MAALEPSAGEAAERAMAALGTAREGWKPRLEAVETGRISSLEKGIAQVTGLGGAWSEEVVMLGGRVPGQVFDIGQDVLGVALLGEGTGLSAGDEVRRTSRGVEVPVGDALLGRVLDPLGRPLDGGGEVRAARWAAIEREAPAILDRAPVSVPLQTGLLVVDTLVPVGRGQRELILGDRQTGKTALALDAILNQKDSGVICIYCAIGQRGASVARVIEALRARGRMGGAIIVVSRGEDPPGVRFIAPYAATAMAEHFMRSGRHALIVYDDLTCHARAYRELSLLFRRPPGREAFPGDIFYVHARLLERATQLRPESGGGSLTALPILETEAQSLSAYIPTNLISITDGQILLASDAFGKAILPAVDIGKSVSRVGGKAQPAAYGAVAGELKLRYSQFLELESFARFGTRLDAATRKSIDRGRCIRECLKQPQFDPLTVVDQINLLTALQGGLLDRLPLQAIPEAKALLRKSASGLPESIRRAISEGKPLETSGREALIQAAEKAFGALPRLP